MNANYAAAAIAAAVLYLGWGYAAFAQSPTASAPAAPGAPSSQNGPTPNGGPSEAPTYAVLRITSVEVVRSAHAPYLDVVLARGVVSSNGWEEVELVPLTRGIPPDGVLQLVLVARPPQRAADASGYEPVEAIFPLARPSLYKGVNVHGATNGLIVAAMPGYAESKLVADDCGVCVGKTLVPRDRPLPTGRTDLIREDQLPPVTRIAGPDSGLMGMESNPNRLTLIVNQDNLIVSAVWD